jgi:hypothetical protein
VFF